MFIFAMSKTLLDRFMAKIERSNDGCWEWKGRTQVKGYGVIDDGPKRQILAHRFSYEVHKAPIPKGLLVCHHCDNRTCVNPDHLFLGTPADNMRDMALKWRSQSRLKESDIIAIREDKRPYREIARSYGLKSHKSISNIKKAKTFSYAGSSSCQSE